MTNQAPAQPKFGAQAAQSSLAKDSLWSLMSEAIAVPSLIITAAILSRTLKAEGMGQFSIAITFMQWFQFAAIAGLGRIGSQVITRQGDDWKAAAGSVMSAFLVSGSVMTLVGMALVPLVTDFLKTPELTPYLLFICLNVLVTSAQTGARTVLAAIGRFRERSVVNLIFWSTRIVLTAILVFGGWQLWGALIAFVGSGVISLVAAFFYVRFPLRFDKSILLKLAPAIPLLISAVAWQLVEKMDLLLIKCLGFSIADAGMFSVAKNVAGVPCILSFAVAPVVVTAVSKHLAVNRPDMAVSVARQALNIILLTLPFAAVMGTSGQELIPLVYGNSFIPSCVYLAPLFITAMLWMVLAVNNVLLNAFYYINVTIIVILAMLLLNLILQPLAITTIGMLGCAYVQLAITAAAVIYTSVYGWNQLHMAYSLRAVGNTALVFGVILIIGSCWVAPLPVPVIKPILVSLMVPVLYFMLRDEGFLLCLQQIKRLRGKS